MLTIAKRQAREFRTADYSADWRPRWCVGRPFYAGWRIGDYPADYAGEKVVGDFTAVAQVDLFEVFGGVGHFEDGVGGDVPDALHLPTPDTGATARHQGVEACVSDVIAIAQVYCLRSIAYEWTDVVY